MKHINYTQLQNWQKEEKNFQLIDVREPFEHEVFNIGGELIPLGDVVQHINKMATDKPIVFYCRKGVRSQIAIQRLRSLLDNEELYNLEGGVNAIQ
jgi:adenylyltransferase/sulfurtransferase